MEINKFFLIVMSLSLLLSCKDENLEGYNNKMKTRLKKELHMTDYWIPKSSLFLSEDKDSLQILREEFITPKKESIFTLVIVKKGKKFDAFKYKITNNKLYQYVDIDSTLYFRYDFTDLRKEIKPTNSMIGMGMIQLALDTEIEKDSNFYFRFFSNFYFYIHNDDQLLETIKNTYPIDYLVFNKKGELQRVRLYENKKWYILKSII